MSSRSTLLLALATALTALSGCGPKYSRGVPKKLVEKLPYESRIELLEAENDLAVAVDRVDEARNEVLRTREAIRRARDRRGDVGREMGRSTDDLSREVARLAMDEADARVDYLRSRQEVNVRETDIDELSLRCAYARFESSRLQVARKAKIEGSERLKQEDFDNDVKRCDAEVAEMKKSLAERNKRAGEFKTKWDAKRSELARKTFDARASPYVE
jgi:hypothetical protein